MSQNVIKDVIEHDKLWHSVTCSITTYDITLSHTPIMSRGYILGLNQKYNINL